jgi:LuxR family maltose regulon positive regulatory protein
MIELRSVPAPADPRSASLRKAGAKAVLIGPASTSPLPFETPDSKTRVPAAPPGSVSRTALVNRLRAAGTFPLVLVSAPAGYGKTTLLSQWAARDVRPFAWVSVDEGDDDPATLLRLLAAALDRVEPLPESALEPLAAERRFAPAKALQRLAAALGSRRSPFVLVLDGADALTHHSIAFVETLVGQAPVGSMIVLSGRVAPDLPVAALRARGPLLELGAYELALSRRETEMLLRASGLEPEDAEINALLERTEGWPAGLYLAALAARAEREDGEVGGVLSVSGTDRYIADYFRSEYLSHLDGDRLTFLRRTAVLETMSGPLCDAVLETKRSALELTSIEEANLFLVALDRQRTSFRYHRLFRDLLLQELEDREPEQVPLINQRAADWFDAQGDAESTFVYSHAAGNEEGAAGILGSIAMPVSAAGRVAAVESWLERFDDDALRRFPAVAVEGARIHALCGRAEQADASLAAAESGAEGETSACIDVVRAAACADGPERMLTRSAAAVAALAPEHPWHPWALVVNGAAHLLVGERHEADEAFAAAAAAADQPDIRSLALSERSLLAAGHDDDLAEALALEARGLIEEGQLDGYATSALDLAATARALLRHGQWDEARRQLTVAMRLAASLTHAIPWLAVQVRLELGHAHVTLRDRSGARVLLDEAKEILALRPALGVLADQLVELEREIDAMPEATDGGSSGLTPAELRLLPLLSTHLSFREIGERLFVSRNTIKTQAISVYRKLGVSSRSDAIARAAELGLVEVAVGGASEGPGDLKTAVS